MSTLPVRRCSPDSCPPLLFGEEEYDARLRVALHGQTPAHHTVIKLNNHHVGDYRWQGQIEFEIEEEIPSSYLRKGTNRLLVQAFASATEGRDQTLFNYFAIDYRSRYVAWPGYLRFSPRTLDRHAVCRVRLFPSRNPPVRHRAAKSFFPGC